MAASKRNTDSMDRTDLREQHWQLRSNVESASITALQSKITTMRAVGTGMKGMGGGEGGGVHMAVKHAVEAAAVRLRRLQARREHRPKAAMNANDGEEEGGGRR
jgi:hypothetical protein